MGSRIGGNRVRYSTDTKLSVCSILRRLACPWCKKKKKDYCVLFFFSFFSKEKILKQQQKGDFVGIKKGDWAGGGGGGD